MQNENILSDLFYVWAGEHPDNIINLPSSGSERKYYRIIGGNKQAIGAFNPNNLENKAFIGFTKHFRKYRLPVPDIYDFDPDQDIYLIQDLGNRTLYDILQEQKTYGFSVEMQEFFKEVIEELLKFQILAGKDLNYSLCYPRASFDRQSMLWDLNYFKYHFLKLARIPFDEQKLEDDFNSLMAFLLEAGSDFFMYRDFQSRNIMVQENKPYFIDYQGGRKGPLQYDLASLLFQVKADIPFDIREQLLDFYISRANIYTSIDKSEFKKYYYGFVYIRLLQVMGAYGFRGLFERKKHFLESIPYIHKNLKWLANNVTLPIQIPELMNVLSGLANFPDFQQQKYTPVNTSNLTVTINSFSYKKGIPRDYSEHGGGFVFDCRVLPNPGREEKYQSFNGKDDIVKDFLESNIEVFEFLSAVYDLIDRSVEKYIERDFTHLMISFGCTGGQHRSVYCAEKMAAHLKQKYPVNATLKHVELD